MGSYSRLMIRHVHFDHWKDSVNSSIMILFNESEKRIQTIPLLPEHERLVEDGETSPLCTVEYVSTVEAMISRLDFLGFSLDTSARVFEIAKIKQIEKYRDSIEAFRQHEDNEGVRNAVDQYQRRIDLLVQASADSWLAALREAFLASPDAEPSQLSVLANSLRPGPSPFTRFPYAFDERFRLRFELGRVHTIVI